MNAKDRAIANRLVARMTNPQWDVWNECQMICEAYFDAHRPFSKFGDDQILKLLRLSIEPAKQMHYDALFKRLAKDDRRVVIKILREMNRLGPDPSNIVR